MKTNLNVNRIVLLSDALGIDTNDLRRITSGSNFLYRKEHQLLNVLCGAFQEFSLIVHQFQNSYNRIMENGTPALDTYIEDINSTIVPEGNGFIIELHAYDMSAFFKSSLLLSKGVLDKLVPLYSYRFSDNMRQFDAKGAGLIKSIKHNKHITRKDAMISLIQDAKMEWIDSLIDLRDRYAHYSNLEEYINFSAYIDSGNKRTFSGISDFHKPAINVSGRRHDALEYILYLKESIITFLRAFLQLCEFTAERRPKLYLECEGRCGHVFAKRHKNGSQKGRLEMIATSMKIRVINRELDYGVIVCPKCGVETDTDIRAWRDNGDLIVQT